MQKNTYDIVIFLIVVSALILALVAFIVLMLYLYRKKQILFFQNIEQMKLDHEKTLMSAQLEMQESTFVNIGREVHDNINLSLTLAKLQLNTIDWHRTEKPQEKVFAATELLTQSIRNLSNLSKGLNADFIKQQGLIKAVEQEVQNIRQTGVVTIKRVITGYPTYMDANKELLVFRIVQEAFNNIIKHAEATNTEVILNYNDTGLIVSVCDDGKGFDTSTKSVNGQAGLKNMQARITMLGGTMTISSRPGNGTLLSFLIPFQPKSKQQDYDKSSNGR
jgi:two-component system, NarL family, sensor kinase